MMKRLRLSVLAAIAPGAMAVPAHADDGWKAVEIVKPYAIEGRTGPELYRSIGERGPRSGKSRARAIAHTNYVLRWDRTFDHSNNACTVVSATPRLTITYTMPEPEQKLASPVRENWAAFYAGILKHEKTHGETAKEITREIVRRTVGLSAPDDPQCRRIRKLLAKEITAMVAVQHARDREFDRVQMSDGGNVQQLVLALVNGG